LVHNLDSAHAGLQKDGDGPVEITPPGVDGSPSLTFTYDDGVQIISATQLVPGQHVVPEAWDTSWPIINFGVLFVGEGGWIHVARYGTLNAHPPSLLDRPVSKAHSVKGNHRDWLDGIRTRRRPRADIRIGACSTILAHLGCIALWLGRKLRWDPIEEAFKGDAEANTLRSRGPREPWSV
jgi:hypothetical protein